MMRHAIGMAGALLLLAGCDSEREVASGTFDAGDGKTGDYVVTEKDGETEMTFRTEEGEVRIGSGADAAAALPEGLPLYPGAEVDSGSTFAATGGPGGGGALVSFTTGDSPEKVIAFYRDAARSAGYEIEAEMTMGDARMIAGKREGADRGFQVSAQADGSGTRATLMAGAGL